MLHPSHLVLRQIFFVTSDSTGGLLAIEFAGMMTEKSRYVLPVQLHHVARV